jgi:hypothetical protein
MSNTPAVGVSIDSNWSRSPPSGRSATTSASAKVMA